MDRNEVIDEIADAIMACDAYQEKYRREFAGFVRNMKSQSVLGYTITTEEPPADGYPANDLPNPFNNKGRKLSQWD
jgi:hypothetical protein